MSLVARGDRVPLHCQSCGVRSGFEYLGHGRYRCPRCGHIQGRGLRS